MPRSESASATLVLSFANTLDVACGIDLLDSPAGLDGWLGENVPIGADTRSAADAAETEIALALRDGLRAAFARHHGPSAHDADDTPEAGAGIGAGTGAGVALLNAAAARLPLRLRFDGDTPRLAPASGGVAEALAEILIAVAETVADDMWPRLKICPADDCRWAFLDTTKNASRTWCSMRVCGNRSKTRSYRARRTG